MRTLALGLSILLLLGVGVGMTAMILWTDAAPRRAPSPAGAREAPSERANAMPAAVPVRDAPREVSPLAQDLVGRVSEWREDMGEEPFAGVEIRLARVQDVAFDEHVAAARSDGRGGFRLRDVEPGEYHLLAFAPGYAPRIEGALHVRGGIPYEPIDLVYGHAALHGDEATARAEVLDLASKGDVAVVPGDPASAEAAAVLDEAISTQLHVSALEGVHELAVVPTLQGEVFSVSFGEGETATLRLWDGESRGSREPKEPDPEMAGVRGMAIDSETAQPIPNAEILVLGRGFERSTRTDAEGRFELLGVPPGDYSVSFEGLANGSLFQASRANLILHLSEGQIVEGLQLLATRIILIERVVPDGQAANAGMLPGDELLTYDGVKVTSRQHLRDLRAARPPEQSVDIVVTRGGANLTFTIQGGTIGVYTGEMYR